MAGIKGPVRALTAHSWFRLPRQPMLRHGLFALLAGVGFYFVTNWFSAFNDYELGEIAFYAIALAGLTLLTGISGQISLGNGGFMAVGGVHARPPLHAHQVEPGARALRGRHRERDRRRDHRHPGHPAARPLPRRHDAHRGARAALSHQSVREHLRRRPGPVHAAAHGADRHQSRAVAGLDPDPGRAGRAGAAGQPAAEPLRALLPGGARRRDRRLAGRDQRAADQGHRLHGLGRLRRSGRRLLGPVGRHHELGRVPARPVRSTCWPAWSSGGPAA